MTKGLLIAVLFLLINQGVYAQKEVLNTNIMGIVQCEGENVSYIMVSVDGTTIGSVTDNEGNYKLVDLPVGSFDLRVSGVGFKTQIQKVTTIKGLTLEVNFDVLLDVLNLDAVVVSADRNEVNRAEAPLVVSSISPKLLISTQALNIGEGLKFSPGLRTENNCSNCGFTQLRINGMEGQYTQILINSRPVFSGLAGVYGLELIPTNMVERLEVIRGGGSVLFGGNAIAGTVNVITKEPTRNTFSIDNRLGIIGVGDSQGSGNSFDKQLNINTSVVSTDGKSGGYLFAMFRDKDQYDENDDGYSESVLLNNSTFGFNVYHKPSIRSKVSLDVYRLDEFRRGGNDFDKQAHESLIAEQLNHLVTGGNVSYDLFTNDKRDKLTVYLAAQHVDRDSYYGAERDPNAYGYTEDLMMTTGGQYVIKRDHFLLDNSTTVLGLDNTNNHIKDTKLGVNGADNLFLANQSVNTFGSFVQQDWSSDKLNVGMGVRVDNYNIYHQDDPHANVSANVFVPRMNVLYKIMPEFRFRIGYSRGYRAPQIFNEDLHIELVNATRVTHQNSTALVQETSHAFTSSLNTFFFIGNLKCDVILEGFYTRLLDAFSDSYSESLENPGEYVYTRVNSEGGASVKGVNIEASTYLYKKIDLDLGLTVQRSLFETSQFWGNAAPSFSKEFVRSPNSYGYATLSYSPTKRLSTSLSLSYTGEMYVPHFGLDADTENPDELLAIANADVIVGERLEYSEKFFVTDFLISYDFELAKETSLQLYFGVKNMFNQLQDVLDRGKYRDAGYIYGPYQPRTINVGIKFGNL